LVILHVVDEALKALNERGKLAWGGFQGDIIVEVGREDRLKIVGDDRRLLEGGRKSFLDFGDIAGPGKIELVQRLEPAL
jgi:hypothetical protein